MPERVTSAGRLVVISGPSGVGKTTVCEEVLRRLPAAMLSVSMTTRPPRSGERDGENYRFVTAEAFQRQEDAGKLLEHAVYQGNRYGTPAEPVERAIAAGRQVVLEIDVQGGMQIAERMPDALRVFIEPPSDDVLRARLIGRATDPPEVQEKRLAAARDEIELAHSSGAYQHFVINDVVDETADAIVRLLQPESTQA